MNEHILTLMTVGLGEFFEGGMLACFGVSWPVSIMKTLRAKRVEGRSLGFLVLVFVGYLSGITAKIARAWYGHEPLEIVTWLYVINALLVATDLALVLHYGRRPAGHV